MRIYNYSAKTIIDKDYFPKEYSKTQELFILCRTHEVHILQDIFGLDHSTVKNCTDLDEIVRYSNYAGYDFISMTHVDISKEGFILREINMYVSSTYIILVMPEHSSMRLKAMENELNNSSKLIAQRDDRINRLYFSIFHLLLADYSDMLETLEDWMQELSENIVAKVNTAQFGQMNILRNMAYTIKKQLRALSYIGEQILVDENELLSKGHLHYFRSIDTRLKKLYDFSENLNNLGSEMLYTYDSRLSMKTNDTINKLTVMTLLFGPLTVITGIYGMNFDNMPALHNKYGYYIALLAMVLISAAIFFILKKKKWI